MLQFVESVWIFMPSNCVTISRQFLLLLKQNKTDLEISDLSFLSYSYFNKKTMNF